jgi:hypothetical protein
VHAPQHHRSAAIAALGIAALALTACAGSSTGSTASVSPAAASSAATVTPSDAASVSPSPSDTVGIPDGASPFSGRPGGAGKPVLVVKFDNTPNAQPHTGLTSADIVYVEEVEFGLTRIAAVFSSVLPRSVGPVRSARISDIDLLAQFGRPAFGYSGAQHRMRPVLAAASIYDVSGDKGPSGYYRDKHRRAPYNFFGVPARLLARAPKASLSQDIGFVFSADAPAGGKAVKSVTANYPSSQAKFVWNAKAMAFDVFLNKRPARATEGGTQHATTVVIQYVRQHDSGYGDKFGGKTPKLETVGTGKGWVLRDGKAYPVTWTRSTATSGTTFTGADGQLVPFAAGQVWVVLVNNKTKAVIA